MKVDKVVGIKRSVKSMQAALDNYVTLAEENNDISYFDKSNAFRKTDREKEDSVKDLEQTIEILEWELKNLKWLSAQVIAFLILLDF